MMGLSDRERISMIRSAVLIQYTRVTDGRTDRRSVARKNSTALDVYWRTGSKQRSGHFVTRVVPLFTRLGRRPDR